VSADDQISPPPKASCIDLGPLWNSLIVDNWFHALDLSRSFNVISPHLTGLSLPSFQDGGPPTSGVGALWPSSDGKYVYLFRADLGDSSWHSRLMWRYNISSDSWSMIATSGVKQVPPIEGASCWIPQYGTNNSGVGVYLGGIIPETSIAMSTVDEGYVASALLFDMAFIQANSAFLMSGTSWFHSNRLSATFTTRLYYLARPCERRRRICSGPGIKQPGHPSKSGRRHQHHNDKIRCPRHLRHFNPNMDKTVYQRSPSF